MSQPLHATESDKTSRFLSLDPHDPEFRQDPYPAYARFHEAGGLVFWKEFDKWCLANFQDVNRLFRDKRFGRQNPAGIPGSAAVSAGREHVADFDAIEACSMLELEPPVHTKLRTLVNRAFVSRQVERLRPRVEALANALVDDIEKNDSADLIEDFATTIPITVIAEMLGVPVEMGPQLVSWSNRMVSMYMHGSTRETQLDANAAARDFTLFLREYVAKRRQSPGEDLLSLLIAAQEGNQKLTEPELIASTILLLNAGHEATVHQTGNAVRTILAQGDDPRRFFTTPQATAATVEECLRYDPPLHMFTRYAYEDVELSPDVTLKAGEQVALLLGAANNDASAFEEPRRFNPQRSDQKNVSFGAGIHFCIGAPLARLEMQVGLKVLFDRLPSLKLTAEPKFRDNYHFHGLERLDVSW